MKSETSMPISAIVGLVIVGAVVAVAAVFRAYEAGQSLDVMMIGRMAAILHIVLRGAMMNVVLWSLLMIACWRFWRTPKESWRKLLPLFLAVKIGTAVFAASFVARFIAMLSMQFFPIMTQSFAALGGWCPFQVLDLVLLFGFMLLFVVITDKIERKVAKLRSMAIRVTFAALGVCLFFILASPLPYRITREFIEGIHEDEIEETKELDSPRNDLPKDNLQRDDNRRIVVDKPWEALA